MLDIVRSLWVSGDLSMMEQTTIRSYLKHGHEFHLYTYGNVGRIPYGTVIRDANEIIPEKDLFLVRGGYSTFSDFFRWKLILDEGGIWSDTDAVCLASYDFPEIMFMGGHGPVGSDDCVSSGVFRLPKGHETAAWAWGECQRMDIQTMPWGEPGPPLFTRAVEKFQLTNYILPGKMFFPIFWTAAPQIFLDPAGFKLPEDIYSVHFFNELWRLAGVNKNAVFPETCLYEQLKARFA